LRNKNDRPSRAARKTAAATPRPQPAPGDRQMATSLIAQILGCLNLLTYGFPESQHFSAAANSAHFWHFWLFWQYNKLLSSRSPAGGIRACVAHPNKEFPNRE